MHYEDHIDDWCPDGQLDIQTYLQVEAVVEVKLRGNRFPARTFTTSLITKLFVPVLDTCGCHCYSPCMCQLPEIQTCKYWLLHSSNHAISDRCCSNGGCTSCNSGCTSCNSGELHATAAGRCSRRSRSGCAGAEDVCQATPAAVLLPNLIFLPELLCQSSTPYTAVASPKK